MFLNVNSLKPFFETLKLHLDQNIMVFIFHSCPCSCKCNHRLWTKPFSSRGEVFTDFNGRLRSSLAPGTRTFLTFEVKVAALGCSLRWWIDVAKINWKERVGLSTRTILRVKLQKCRADTLFSCTLLPTPTTEPAIWSHIGICCGLLLCHTQILRHSEIKQMQHKTGSLIFY